MKDHISFITHSLLCILIISSFPIIGHSQTLYDYEIVTDVAVTKRMTRDKIMQLIKYSESYDIDSRDTTFKNNPLPDSVYGIFKISQIIKKKDNYIVQNGKLKKLTLFIYEAVCLSDSSNSNTVRYIRIISPKEYSINCVKIKKKHQYQLVLYSISKTDCCSNKDKEGNVIYMIRKPEEHKQSVLYKKKIWISCIDISSYNYFSSPNIIGRYYYAP